MILLIQSFFIETNVGIDTNCIYVMKNTGIFKKIRKKGNIIVQNDDTIEVVKLL